jgi:ribosomal protein S18 acetylase RimI-like enzyme
MMRFLEDVARQHGRNAIHIGVRESLPSNVALYVKLGYQEIRREPHGADRSITMLKQL